jgi:hypothetical protein
MDSSEARAKLDELLKAFGAATGLPGLATEDNGVCILVIDGRTNLYLLVDHSTETLVVWSTIATLPAGKAEPILRALMHANLFWTGTQGATLGLMPESDDIVLAIRRPVVSVDADGLRDLIELMIERIEALAPVAAGQSAAIAETEHTPTAFTSAIRG